MFHSKPRVHLLPVIAFELVFVMALAANQAFAQKNSPALKVSNKVILAKQPDTYMEVRHIVISGTNREIGKALGDIAREWLGVKLTRYAATVYAKANRRYMERNYPILAKRMKGVAKSYGISDNDDTYVTSYLMYDMGPFSCSALYLPPSVTADGHPLFVQSVDFYTTTLRKMLGMEPVDSDRNMFSRNFVMELYPDKGYSSLVLGTWDFLNGAQSGMNSEGLVVAMLADNNGPKQDMTRPDLGDESGGGLTIFQLFRLVLDTCSTLDEAKIALLNNKLLPGFEPSHLIVSDNKGGSFIFEHSSKDLLGYITDNGGNPQIMTNHAVHKYPNVSSFPEVPAKATYNSFYRYRALHDYIQGHPEKFSFNDARHALTLVQAHTHDTDEGAAFPTPCRTMWPLVWDMTKRTVEVSFYLKDGNVDTATGVPQLLFSEPFTFTLKAKSLK